VQILAAVERDSKSAPAAMLESLFLLERVPGGLASAQNQLQTVGDGGQGHAIECECLYLYLHRMSNVDEA
jgi:hypothetical protein